MENKKLSELVAELNRYLSENGWNEELTAEKLASDKEALDRVTDAVIALICKIGVDENFAPNIHGIILDGYLEKLNGIREEYFKNE